MTTYGCVNNTIRLRSGLYFDLADPQPDQFTFADIAGALSKICRFGGQCEWFYSVAEHCWHCTQQAIADGLPVEAQRAVLLHDAAEAFAGDIVKPLKIMLGEYGRIERRIEDVIAAKFGLAKWSDAVRKIDHEMLIAERRFMFTSDGVIWSGENDVRPLRVEFMKWPPDSAELNFLLMAKDIGVKLS